MQKVRVTYEAKEFVAERGSSRTPSTERQVPTEKRAMWYLRLGPTALTKFPARPDDTDASVRERVLAWIRTHPDLKDRDQINLGGG